MQSILQRLADEETLEEVEGDLAEFYLEWVRTKGRRRANWKYLFTMLTLLQPLKKKRSEISRSNTMVMIKSYFIMSYRTILRNKLSSLINISGLTLGLTTSLLILLVVIPEFNYDDQHINKESVFLMMKNQRTNDGISTGRSTAGPMAETLRSGYPQVIHAARVAYFNGASLIVNDKKSSESGVYVDPEIFSIMTYEVVKGDPLKALKNNSVVVNERMAATLFGDHEAIGQIIILNGNTLSVGAIIKDIPQQNTVRFRIAAPFSVFERTNPWLSKWDDNRIQTWVQLRSADDLDTFNQQVAPLIHQKTNDPNETVFAYPLNSLHLYGQFTNGQPSGGMITIIQVIIGFGIFLLLIACVNFMNIATAQSSRRAKEVGVRKVLGAARKNIVFQFMNESLVITATSLVAAIGLCILVIPSFNTMMHTSISFDFTKVIVWSLCLSVTLITALIAGSYPAFVLSRFAPVRVLKGLVDLPGGLPVRRLLVGFQFMISISVLVGTIILYAQFDHIKNRPLGYEQENLINISLDSTASARFDIVKEEVLKVPGVKSVTGTGDNVLYSGGSITGMDWPGKRPGEELAISVANASYDWSKTLGTQILAGRDFDQSFKSDENACLINQSAADKMRLADPVGSVVGNHTVIGVFKDYVYNNPSGVIAPLILYLSTDNIRHMYVRIENNDEWTGALSAVEKSMKTVSPDLEFDFRFTSQEYQSRFEEFRDLSLMVSIFGGMTIFISCLGLFGLSGFIAEKRSKEMSIRKVHGADSIRIFWSLSTDVLMPVVAALAIVLPLSVWVSRSILEEFVYRVSLTWWMFAQAGLIVLVIGGLVVFYHSWRTANESPAVRLKGE